MKQRVRLVLSLLFAALVGGCDSRAPDAVLLRVENASSADFSSVLVRFPGAEARYGAVDAGAASAYREVETAYRYGYVEVEAGSATHRRVPIDYVGETPLEEGRYTFVLDLAGDVLSLHFAQD